VHQVVFFFTTTVTDCYFAKKMSKMLFFSADYIFTIHAPLADEKENNFSRKFFRGTCRIYPCNDTNKLRHGRFSRIMSIWKLPLCSELLCTCWPQLLAALYLCHYISQSFLAEYALLLNVTRCLNYRDDIFDASYTNSQACWIQSCQLSISHIAIGAIILATLK
jgi:hypothetical protein